MGNEGLKKSLLILIAIKILDTGVLGEVRGLKANRINTNCFTKTE